MVIPSRRGPAVRAWSLAAALLTLSPVLAQEPPGAPQPSQKAELTPPPAGFDVAIFQGKRVQRITLQQAIEMALHNNLEVAFEKVGITVARAQVRLAAGAFDPQVFAISQYQRNRRAQDINNPSTTQAVQNQQQLALQLNQSALALNGQTISATEQQVAIAQSQQFQLQAQQDIINQQRIAQGLAPIDLPAVTDVQPLLLPTDAVQQPVINDIVIFDQRNLQFQAGIQGRTSIGTRYSFQATVSDERNTFRGDTNPVDDLFETFIGLNVQQPLLKNFGKDANLLDLRSAQIQAKIQTFTWKQNIASAVQGVMAAYYDMLYALNDINVRQAAIAADSSLVQLYQKRVDLGFNSPFDVRQAQAAVSSDQEALLNSKFTFLERQFALQRLITREPRNDARIYIPADAPHLFVPSLQRSQLLSTAFQGRYDYQAVLLNADLQNVRLRFAKNQLLPQLDLIASYGLNGLGRSYGESFEEAGRFSTPSYSVGIQFQVPIGNRQPRAQYDAIRAQKEQALLRIKNSEISLETDVDTVIARIETNQQRVAAARQTRELNEEAVRIGYRRLEEGLVSAYDITEQQRKLYDAKSRELAAISDLNKSITQLWLVTGTVLDREKIMFNEPVEMKGDKAMMGKALPEAVATQPGRAASSTAPGAAPGPPVKLIRRH